jgi:RNA polymerase sigma factor (sigma-70 family)
MTEDELNLWERHGRGDETARQELILLYLPLVDLLARRIALRTGANWQDLRQEGIIGLIKAVARFDHSQGVSFKTFAPYYIRGEIFDSSELTRNMARRQEEIYRKMRRIEEELTKTLQRNPTIEEVAEKAELTVEQILNAIDARGVAFAGELPDAEVMQASYTIEPLQSERTDFLMEAISHLDARGEQVIRLYYWEDQPHEEIAQMLGLTASNVMKIRQRAIAKLRKQLDV